MLVSVILFLVVVASSATAAALTFSTADISVMAASLAILLSESGISSP